MKSAIVVVLGDVGRSPRMCYHALSLADHGVEVEMVGYLENEPHGRLRAHPRIKLVELRPPPPFLASIPLPRFVVGVARALWMLLFCSWTLLFGTSPQASILLMQNPPGIPTMAVCLIASKLKGARFIIDWHNYTHSILAASDRHSQAWLAHRWEAFFGKRADGAICVSKAMQKDLRERYGARKSKSWAPKKHTSTLDGHFRPFSAEERRLFMEKFIHEALTSPGSCDDGCRPFVLVSCTSWTEDEDFGILLDALVTYDQLVAAREGDAQQLPKLLVIITGKGPMKEYYSRRVQAIEYSNVRVVTVWVAAEDYPRLLASADLGVSLHTSTSGLDLPMKIVDMFGCHLPVVAVRFPAIDELVDDGRDGVLFDTSDELAMTLASLTEGFPDNTQKLDSMRRELKGRTITWEQQWDRIMWPFVESLITE